MKATAKVTRLLALVTMIASPIYATAQPHVGVWTARDHRITSYNVCYTKLLRWKRRCARAGRASTTRSPSVTACGWNCPRSRSRWAWSCT